MRLENIIVRHSLFFHTLAAVSMALLGTGLVSIGYGVVGSIWLLMAVVWTLVVVEGYAP